MSPTQARAIAQTLNDAADEAEANGNDDINLLEGLRSADDAARAELQAAIDAASE